MAVYDVNGDGLNDVVTSLQAHGLGLSWFEQKKAADGSRSFVEHPIMTDFSTKNAGGVMFSQLHGATYADVDGDGLQDFITGKRFWSHLDTFIDPDPHGAPVLYVYRTVRNAKAPGGAEFVPELIHNRSGVGSHLSVVDLNKDGSAEIITSTKRGTFIFWNNWKAQAITCDSFAPRPSSLRLHRSSALRRRSQRKTGRRTATTPARSDTRRSSRSIRPTSSNLRLVWTYDTPAAVPPPPARGGGAREPGRRRPPNAAPPARGESPAAPAIPAPRQSATTPLVVDGVMYMATMYNRVVALDADTGKEIWVKDIGHTPSTRGIAYWPGTNGIPPQLVFGTGDGSSLLISLNAKTGEFTPGFGTGRQGGLAARRRREISAAAGRAVVSAGDLQTSRDHRQSLAGEPKPRTLGRRACMGPADGQARLDVSHDSQAGRAEPRRVEKRSVGRSRRSQRLGIHHRR